MSQSLRERIEGLTGVCGMVERREVLRIIAEHEREQAAVAIGVRPVAQPSEKVGELPAWLRELERLQLMACDKDQIDLRHTLLELANLRRVILSGNGEAVIPIEVARLMTIRPGGHHPAGAWVVSDGVWIHEGMAHSNDSDYILTAIDAYANTLITP